MMIQSATQVKLQIFSMTIFQAQATKFSKKFQSSKVAIIHTYTKKNKNGKYFINPDGHTFFLTPTDPKEVGEIIDKLNAKKSPGPNGIPVFLLKKFKIFFSYWLVRLFSLCFETGNFPDLLKFAKVTPLHKKSSKLDYHNYRPISLLSVCSKIN